MQVGLQVAGRMVKYSYYIARISSFIASKMQSSVTMNLVFPSCGDIKILQLLVCTSHDLALIGLLYKAYPNGCQHRLQVLPRLRLYSMRGHRLLFAHYMSGRCVSSADVDVPRSSNIGCHAEMMCSCKDGMCWWAFGCVA